MNTPNIQQFKRFAHDHADLAHAVAMAQAFAQCERERVAAYILPLFRDYRFMATLNKRREPYPITGPEQLYLCEDETACKEFYAAADLEHRKHGFTGPIGHCPALVAEELQRIAERALLEAGGALFGSPLEDCYGEHRAKGLDLLMGACLKARSERKAA